MEGGRDVDEDRGVDEDWGVDEDSGVDRGCGSDGSRVAEEGLLDETSRGIA